MKLHAIDISILISYLAAMVMIGWLLRKKARLNKESYMLGGKQLPWYMLGMSDASDMFDISGTMWMVALCFVYGLKSIWIPWLWPVFNQIFLMVFMSVWLRRSGVMTGAEWIKFRFGAGRGANLAHVIVVVFALFNVIGFLAYAFIGIGKFASTFLPWQLASDPVTNVNLWGLLITSLTALYVVKGGMYSVVFTEVLQAALKTIACIWVAIIAIQRVSPEMIASVVPAGWHTPWFGWKLGLDWSRTVPAANQQILNDGWTLFSA